MTEQKLLAYYLGTLDFDQRIAVEDKMLNSSAFLMEYLVLKRSLEQPSDNAIEPSIHLQARLRRDFSRMFVKKGKRYSWKIIIPAVAAAFGLFLVTSLFFKSQPTTTEERAFVFSNIDTASEIPVSLNTL